MADEKIDLLGAIHDRNPVAGLTHSFYRYPARFSPMFARAAIKWFTKPGDLVCDPFMGGGTSLVEASALGRRSIGVDINSLAVFLARVKTQQLGPRDLACIQAWFADLPERLNLHNASQLDHAWKESGYQRNISGPSTWPVRKTIELALGHLSELEGIKQQEFARCVLLRTAQWALDCRTDVPSANEIRGRLMMHLADMVDGYRCYAKAVQEATTGVGHVTPQTICLHRSTIGLHQDTALATLPRPALILTSPPYPGVHVLYHRWQVLGRREAPAPYWIAGTHDGAGASFYTFGDRQAHSKRYGEYLAHAFESLAQIAGPRTMVVQMVAFSDPASQLPEYLRVLESVGFEETSPPVTVDSHDGRIWRSVPNRKWYAGRHRNLASSQEVVLFHRLARSKR